MENTRKLKDFIGTIKSDYELKQNNDSNVFDQNIFDQLSIFEDSMEPKAVSNLSPSVLDQFDESMELLEEKVTSRGGKSSKP